jgi:hypothetical protein
MNPEEKPPSFKVAFKAWGRFGLRRQKNYDLVHFMTGTVAARTLALKQRNKYIPHGIRSGGGIDSDYFPMIAVTPSTSDDIIYRVVD